MALTEGQIEDQIEDLAFMHLAKMKDLHRVSLRVISGMARTNTLLIGQIGQVNIPPELRMEKEALEELKSLLSPIEISDNETTEEDKIVVNGNGVI